MQEILCLITQVYSSTIYYLFRISINLSFILINILKADSIHLYREVVLLTDDRNLRLKAHTRHVPVKNIVSFCKWSNIPLRKTTR
jgi:hypothetical protein